LGNLGRGVVTVLTTEVVVGLTVVVGRGTLLSGIVGGTVFNLSGAVVGASVVLESAAFLVRGLIGGTGVVTVLGFVVVGSAAFFVRGLADGGGLGLDGEAWCAWAAPAATSPPLRRARANAAARTGRRFDISGPYAFGPNARAM
jgi:hypothetical protein